PPSAVCGTAALGCVWHSRPRLCVAQPPSAVQRPAALRAAAPEAATARKPARALPVRGRSTGGAVVEQSQFVDRKPLVQRGRSNRCPPLPPPQAGGIMPA